MYANLQEEDFEIDLFKERMFNNIKYMINIIIYYTGDTNGAP